MANVLLKHLDKTYPNGYHAVRDVNLEIADGEFIVLVGPSGCGKSTTLRMVAGLEEATGGEIWIGDRLVNDVAPGDRDIAMVFQNYALYPHMSVYQNMAFGLKMRRTPKAEIDKRVREAAAILSIESLLDRRPRELSGGQRQRVALGRAIVREPKVFLFDEPLSNLDAKLRVQMRAEIARLHQRLKTTIIYVTHDQVEAMTLGDRIVLMDRGVIQQVDTPMNIYQRPANQFVASFIGSPAMNFIRGQIEDGVFRFANGAGERPSRRHDEIPSAARRPTAPPCSASDRRICLPREQMADRLGERHARRRRTHGPRNDRPFRAGRQRACRRLAADAGVQPGDRLALSIRPGAFHLFSDADGRRLN